MPARRWTLMLMLNPDAPRNCPSEQLYQRASHELESPLVGQARAGPKVVVQDAKLGPGSGSRCSTARPYRPDKSRISAGDYCCETEGVLCHAANKCKRDMIQHLALRK